MSMNETAKNYIQDLINLNKYQLEDLKSLPLFYSNARQEEFQLLLEENIKALELIFKKYG